MTTMGKGIDSEREALSTHGGATKSQKPKKSKNSKCS